MGMVYPVIYYHPCPQLANVDLAVYGDLAVGRVVILNNPSVRVLGQTWPSAAATRFDPLP